MSKDKNKQYKKSFRFIPSDASACRYDELTNIRIKTMPNFFVYFL